MNYIRTTFVYFAIASFFTVIYGQVDFTSSDIPIVIINTNGQEIPDEPKINAEMKIVDNNLGLRNFTTGPYSSYNDNIRIEIRGSTSQTFPKKQYAFETCDSFGNNLNVSLIGLPKENDWILYAPYSDKSLIRNVLAYNLARETSQYASRGRFCELVLNDEYMGLYVLFEKIKRDRSRVNISKLTSEDTTGDDITGGYIIKIDKTTENKCEPFYSSFSDSHFQFYYPDCGDITSEQKSYIQNFIYEFEEILFSTNFRDPQNGYYNFIDMNSFVDYMIVNEIAKNIDAYRWSTFMYKTKDSKGGRLHMGPVWDFNIAFGNVNYQDGFRSDSLVIINHPWLIRLLEDSVFNRAINKRWHELRSRKLSDCRVLQMIDSLTFILEESSERNFARWDILGQQIWPNYYVGETYIEEIKYLKSWIIDRLYWLDHNISKAREMPNFAYKNALKGYPNPFEDQLSIRFELKKSGVISLKLYDIMGQLQGVVVSEEFYNRGIHKLSHYLASGSSNSLKRGVYILVLELDNKPISRFRVVKN